MELDIFTNGNEYISASRASEKTGYSSDYIGQLCRTKKIPGKLIGRTWYVDLSALLEHKKTRKLGKPKGSKSSPSTEFEGSITYQADDRPALPQLLKVSLGEEMEAEKKTTFTFNKRYVAVALSLVLLVGLGTSLSGKKIPVEFSRSMGVTQLAAVSFFDALSGTVETFVDSFGNLKNIALKNFFNSESKPLERVPNIKLATPAEPESQALENSTPTLGTIPITSDLRSELLSYIDTKFSTAKSPVIIRETPVYNTTVLRNEILSTDTRPAISRQSDSDADRRSDIFNTLTTAGEFSNSVLTDASITGNSTASLNRLTFANATGTNATTTNFYSSIGSFGNLTLTNLTASYSSLGDATSTTFAITGDGAGLTFYGSGNHDITADSGTLRLGSNVVIGNIEALDNTIDIGTPGVRFDKIYADEVNASTIVGTLTGGNLTAETFNINSDNATADGEDSYLSFERGTTVPNALLRWDSTNKRFTLNAPFSLVGGIGNGDLLVSGSSTLQNLTFINATGTSATTTTFYSDTASSTNLFSSIANLANLTANSITSSGLLSFTGTDHAGIKLNNLTTTERNSLSPTAGMTIFNTSDTKMQVYNGSGWKNVGNPEIGAEVTSGTSGSVLFVDSSGNLAQDNANLFWNSTLSKFVATNIESTNSTSTNATSTNSYFSNTLTGPGSFTVDSSGNVGIGTTDPSTKLEVSGSGGRQFQITSNNTAGAVYGFITSNGTNGLYFGQESNVGNSFFTDGLVNASAIGTGNATALQFATNNNMRMTILSDGNVGIGTTGPGAKLQINSATASNVGLIIKTTDDSTTNKLQEWQNSSGIVLGSVTTSGNSGILNINSGGTSNPTARLSGPWGLEISSDREIRWSNSSSNLDTIDTRLQRLSAGKLQVLDASSNLATFLAGTVGIGTTTPAYKLTVNSTSASENLFQVSTTTNQSIFTINSAGNVGIGTSTPSAQLAVNDSLYVGNTGGTATSTFEGGLKVEGALQVGTGSTYIDTNSLSFSTGGSITNNSGKLEIQAGGSGTGSTGTGSIYFLDSIENTRGRLGTSADDIVITGSGAVANGGSGGDGAATINGGGTTNCQTTAIAAGRVNADCVATGISTTSASGQAVVTVTSTTGFDEGDEVLLIQMTGTGVGAYEFRTISSVDSGTQVTVTANLNNTYTNDGSSKPQMVRVPNYTNVTISNSTTLTISTWDGTTGGVLAFRATGTVSVESGSVIDLNEKGFGGGGGGSAGTAGTGGTPTNTGGTGGTGGTGSTGSGSGGGAGGATGGGGGVGGGGSADPGNGSGAGGSPGGGAGGSYTSGTNGNNGVSGTGGTGSTCGTGGCPSGGAGAAGSGGATSSSVGTANLSTMFLGSGGGGGGGSAGGGGGGGNNSGYSGGAGGAGRTGGAGGRGGGLAFIEATTISNSGTIRANGGTGSVGLAGLAGSAGNGSNSGSGGGSAPSAGGGGGSGGAIYVQADTITAGTITATGGSGGAGSSTGGAGGYDSGTGKRGGAGASVQAGTGGTGGSGRIRCDSAAGSGCSTTPSADENVYTGDLGGYGTLYIGSVNTSSADLAEYYVTGDRNLRAGDVVCLSNERVLDDGGTEIVNQGVLRKCQSPNDPKLIGVISTAPGVTLGSIDGKNGNSDNRALALQGRVPVAISTENGEVKIGDYLTSSSMPGVAMKADGFSNVIGIALGNFNGFGGSTAIVGTKTVKTGKVEVFMNLTYRKLDIAKETVIGEDGTESVVYAVKEFDLTSQKLIGIRSLSSLSGKWSISEEGTITASKLCLEDICIGKDSFSFLSSLVSTSTATSTASSTPDSASGWLQLIWDFVSRKLADATNGIGDFFANRVHTKEICVGDEGEQETCLTKAQLDQLLSSANISTTQIIVETGNSGASDTSTTTEENMDVATTTEEVIVETSATSTPETVEETATSTPEEVVTDAVTEEVLVEDTTSTTAAETTTEETTTETSSSTPDTAN